MGSDADPDELIGQTLAGRYRIESRLGSGAMGMVYLARHVKVGREFAVKVLHPRLVADDKIMRRFAREAELAGSLNHPNVVSVVDVGETSGMRYLVMDFAKGITLYELIGEAAPMPAARVVSIARQLCAGLEHAHDRGLIHRDFKPENVIVDKTDAADIPKIVDFGVAILLDDAASSSPDRLTSVGLVLGTPHYMAPEHATGSPIDHRIDLFALGVICFEMLTGRPPFDGDGVEVARANLMQETPAMSTRVPGLWVDPLLEAFTRKLMMKSRDHRPANAHAARELLDLIERDRPAAAAALGLAVAEYHPPVPQSTRTAPRAAVSEPVMTGEPEPLITDEPLPRLTTEADPPRLTTESDLTVRPTSLERGPLPWIAQAWPSTPEAVDDLPAHRRYRGRTLAAIAGFVVIAAMIVALTVHHAPPAAPPPKLSAPVELPRDPASPPAPNGAAPMAATIATANGSASAGSPPPPMAPLAAKQPTAPVARVAAHRPPTSRHAEQSPIGELPTTKPSAPVVAVDAPAAAAAPAPAQSPELMIVQPAPATASPPPTGPVRPTSVLTPPPVTPTSVAQLYSTVGQQLKLLDQVRGSGATADLWPVFRQIRINDVIADGIKCQEADALLRHLHDQIEIRAR